MSHEMTKEQDQADAAADVVAELPPVEVVDDLALAKMFKQLQIVNEKEADVKKASMMKKAEAAELYMSASRDLLAAQCSLIFNLKAEITRLRKYGFAAE